MSKTSQISHLGIPRRRSGRPRAGVRTGELAAQVDDVGLAMRRSIAPVSVASGSSEIGCTLADWGLAMRVALGSALDRLGLAVLLAGSDCLVGCGAGYSVGAAVDVVAGCDVAL